MYPIGGQANRLTGANGPQNSTEYFDVSANEWKYGPEMITPVYSHAMVTISNTEAIIVAGTTGAQFQSVVQLLDTSGSGSVTAYPGGPLNAMRIEHDAAKVTLSNGNEVVLVLEGRLFQGNFVRGNIEVSTLPAK